VSSDPPVSLWPDPSALGSVTDLYEVTMMAGYMAMDMDRTPATFELFVRRLPPDRAFLVYAGLEQVLGDLLRLSFSAEQVDALRQLPVFARVDPRILDRFRDLRFTGDVWSVPEGTVVFPGEPLVRVEAPLAEAQWIETYLIASLNYPTLVASKAARMVLASNGRPLYDFGARRGHGPHAGLLAARAAYLAGFEGSSHLEAARRLGMPAIGTMAHSWVQAFGSEAIAFEAFTKVFGSDVSTLLVDTYDTLEGVRLAARIEPPIRAVRIDSGDVAELSRSARQILDDAGRPGVQILASGDLDEYRISELVQSGSPVDAFGVGTELVTSRDAPALSMVYKLVAMAGEGRVKRSPGKATYPLGKQVHRFRDGNDCFLRDLVTGADEIVGGECLLELVVEGGHLIRTLPRLDEIRKRCRSQLASLPGRLRGVHAAPGYRLEYSEQLELAAAHLGLRS
jgi:nicotinate phosphoribosyltransferase